MSLAKRKRDAFEDNYFTAVKSRNHAIRYVRNSNLSYYFLSKQQESWGQLRSKLKLLHSGAVIFVSDENIHWMRRIFDATRTKQDNKALFNEMFAKEISASCRTSIPELVFYDVRDENKGAFGESGEFIGCSVDGCILSWKLDEKYHRQPKYHKLVLFEENEFITTMFVTSE